MVLWVFLQVRSRITREKVVCHQSSKLDIKLLNLPSKDSQFRPTNIRSKPKPNFSENVILGVLNVMV
jgi:hypothetical protein